MTMKTMLGAVLMVTTSALALPAAAETVKIGVMTDLSGPDSDMAGAGSVLAAQMAIEDFGGKAGGFDVELISADHQRKPDVAAALASRWYDNDGVDLILDVPLSSPATAARSQFSRPPPPPT
jgi:branched-chain amino acid transport system substrate-binding protein